MTFDELMEDAEANGVDAALRTAAEKARAIWTFDHLNS
jgi:hypothetical protein